MVFPMLAYDPAKLINAGMGFLGAANIPYFQDVVLVWNQISLSSSQPLDDGAITLLSSKTQKNLNSRIVQFY